MNINNLGTTKKYDDGNHKEIFKDFEKNKKRETSKPSDNCERANLITFRLPPKRSKRLKSEIFVQGLPNALLDDDKLFNTSVLNFEPQKKKIKFSTNANDSVGGTNLESEDLNGTDSILGKNSKENNNLKKPQKSNSISGTISKSTVEILKDTSLANDNNEHVSEILETSKMNVKFKQIETYDQIVKESLNDKKPQNVLNEKDNDCTESAETPKQLKTRGRKSATEKSKKEKTGCFDLENIHNSHIYMNNNSDEKLEKSIETSTTVEMLNDPSLWNGNSKDTNKILKTLKKNRKFKQIETCDQTLEENMNDGEPQTEKFNDIESTEIPKRPKTRGKKSTAEKLKDSYVSSNESSDEHKKGKTDNFDFEKTNNSDENLKKTAKLPVQPKKRGRKPKSLNKSLKDGSSNTNSSSNENGNLKYFTVDDKKTDKVVKTLNCPKMNKSKIQNENSETLQENIQTYDSSIDDNLQASQSSIDENIKNSVTTFTNKLNTSLNKRDNTKQAAVQRVIKVNIANKYQKKRTTKLSKLTKQQIKNGTKRKIPKNRLDDVLEMINDDDHPVWEDRNISCNPSIHRHWQLRDLLISDQNMKLKYARQFLLRRDWTSLSKILCLYNSEAKTYYPLLSKYATLLLAHTDQEQFDKFVKFLTNMNDSSAVMKKCTTISKDNEE